MREVLRNIIDLMYQEHYWCDIPEYITKEIFILNNVDVLFCFVTCGGDWLNGTTSISGWLTFRIKEHNKSERYESDDQVQLLGLWAEVSPCDNVGWLVWPMLYAVDFGGYDQILSTHCARLCTVVTLSCRIYTYMLKRFMVLTSLLGEVMKDQMLHYS